MNQYGQYVHCSEPKPARTMKFMIRRQVFSKYKEFAKNKLQNGEKPLGKVRLVEHEDYPLEDPETGDIILVSICGWKQTWTN